MKRGGFIASVLACTLLAWSCNDTVFESKELTSGTADFHNYVSIGNSLTQGFQDFGLHNTYGEQADSYPAIIARQMKLVTPTMQPFVQPLVNGNGSGYIHLEYVDGELEAINADEPGGYGPDASWSSWGDQNVKYNNLGVAGIKLADCVPTQGSLLSGTINSVVNSFNPYGSFLDFGTPLVNEISYLDHIEGSSATFFTCWLGNNDILGYAIAGGESTGIDILGLVNIDLTTLTDPQEFDEKYDAVLAACSNMGADGICATIPDITSIPLFTTITPEAKGVETLWITEGDGTVREFGAGDFILLTANDAIDIDDRGLTQAKPLESGHVLDSEESAAVASRTDVFNTHIRTTAEKYNYPVADMFQHLTGYETGVTLDGVDYSTAFVRGGVFSLDGIHPNRKGYAIVANLFIEAINQHYGSTVPKVDVNDYKGIIYPN